MALEPGSVDWIEAHQKGITASDAAVAVGLGKYALPRSLWEVKVGIVERTQDDNQHTRHGITLEPIVRKMYEIWMSTQVSTCSLAWHKDASLSFVGCIPDGETTITEINPEDNSKKLKKILLEIKCPSLLEWDYIPAEYMVQMQIQLEVFDADACDFVCYFQKSKLVKVWRVYRSKLYWKWLEPKLRIFWDCVQQNTQPTSEQIPHLYQIASDLAKANYNYGLPEFQQLNRKLFPPKVLYTMQLEKIWDHTQVKPASEPLWRKVLVWIVIFLLLLVIFLNFGDVITT